MPRGNSLPPQKPCVIRRCDRPPVLWVGHEGYICEHHADMIWRKVERRDTEKCDEPVIGAEAREYDRADFRAKRSIEKRKPTAMGQIYFVQVDDLIKVGWTTKLADRIRAYGPKAELLANYPGTRSDEATLHRQLGPARFKGREWYSDCDVIQAFITEAREKYGPPRFERHPWTTPKQIVAGKRHR